MLLGLAIGIGISVVLIGLYAWGRWMYGDQWYVAFGRNVARSDDDLTDEGWLSGLLTVSGSDNVVGGLHPHESRCRLARNQAGTRV